MAKKKNELVETAEVETKKFKMKDYKSEIDSYIKEKLESETKKNFNLKDYKDQIDKYIKERVEVESASQSVKLLKKQLKNKKISSAIKSFLILCLLACIGYGVYYLYEDGYFDEDKNKCSVKVTNKDNKVIDDNNVNPSKPEKKEASLEDLTKEYARLVDKIVFDANSNYTSDYYSGNLTNEIKLYLAYKLIGEDNIISDDESSYFEASDLRKSYVKLFDDDIKLTSFKYNNASYLYFDAKDMYVSGTKPNEDKVVSREIIDIDVDSNKVTITCVEGLVSDGKLYNIVNNKQVNGYKSNDALSKYKDKLNVIKYTFEDEYLIDITK